MTGAMKRIATFTALALVAVPSLATPGGQLGTLPLGNYVCSLPGDATGAAWQVVPEKGFTIGNASTYHTDAGSGTYLLTGDTVKFTRGPMKGMRFARETRGSLRWLDAEGKPGRVRCVRAGASR
jgi:hypothetical protein